MVFFREICRNNTKLNFEGKRKRNSNKQVTYCDLAKYCVPTPFDT